MIGRLHHAVIDRPDLGCWVYADPAGHPFCPLPTLSRAGTIADGKGG